MILQSKLDLSTFEIIRFRIWNQTSNPDDFGIGTKYFNTNSGHDGYNRENIFTETGWRKTAYLDDIDKINEKLDLIFGDELDTDTIIDSWKEVQDFLSGIEDTKNLMTMLDGKLDTKGGTIKGDSWLPLSIISGNASSVAITLSPSSGNGMQLGWSSAQGAFVFNYQNNCQIGVHPDGYAYFKTYTDLYPLLHEGNVGEYTAGAANRLANKVSLWGNEFDGTKSLDNNHIYLANQRSIAWKSSDGAANIEVLVLNNGNDFLIGQGVARVEGNTYIYGNNIKFCYGTAGSSAQTAMTITNGGNVNIGAVFDGFKFSVYGGITFLHGVESSALALGQMPTNGLLVGNTNYGIGQWFQGGQGHIQASSFGNTTATAYTLNLNPLGGSVNVGEGGLNVAKKVVISKDSLNTKVAYAGTAGGANYIWGYDTNNYLCIGAQGTKLTRATSSMVVESNAVSPGTNNAVSLGTSSYRWSNVYSTLGDFNGAVAIHSNVDGAELLRFSTDRPWKFSQLGTGAATSLCLSPDATSKKFIIADADKTPKFVFTINGEYSHARFDSLFSATGLATFSDRVLIGGAVDDADYALNVKGDSYFGGTVYIPTGQKLTIGSVTFEEDAAGRVKVGGDMYTTGTLASGGKAKEGTGTGSGSANVRDFELPADGKTTYDCDHLLKSKNVIVQVFEKAIQNKIEVWEMILTDVTIVTEDRVTVTFGRPTTKVHKVHIIGGNVS